MRPSGTRNIVGMLSQGCASLHPGLLSDLPYGKNADSLVHTFRARHSSRGMWALSSHGVGGVVVYLDAREVISSSWRMFQEWPANFGGVPRGLKPIALPVTFGTTEVVP